MKRDPAAGQHGLLRSAGVVSAAVLLSRLTGLVRETAMARLFGAGVVYDAFLTGVRIPNLTRNLFAEGALSSAFVPTFTEALTTGTALEAAELAQVVATALTLAAGAVCVAGMIFSPQLVRLLAPGIRARAGQVRAHRSADAHHVSLPAAGGAGGGSDGDSERARPVRRAGAGFHVLQHRLRRERAGAGADGREALAAGDDCVDGGRRGDRRRAATGLANAELAPRRLFVPARASISRTRGCGGSRG